MNSHISVGLFVSFKAHISLVILCDDGKKIKNKKNRPSIKSHFRWCTGIEIAKFVWLMYHFLSHILTSNLNRIPIKWSICNESMTTRQKKIVSGSDKVWNNDGCAVYICLTKTKKKNCKSPEHLGTYTGAYIQKKLWPTIASAVVSFYLQFELILVTSFLWQ